ncbi:MAG: hypothetical protein WCA32_16020, partial [Chromatiaceae bacterium]
ATHPAAAALFCKPAGPASDTLILFRISSLAGGQRMLQELEGPFERFAHFVHKFGKGRIHFRKGLRMSPFDCRLPLGQSVLREAKEPEIGGGEMLEMDPARHR